MAIDTWFGRSVLGHSFAGAYHPLGQPNREYAEDGYDTRLFVDGVPTFAEVVTAFHERIGAFRAFVLTAGDSVLAEPCPDAWSPERAVTVGDGVRTILHEAWEHLRFALRDLDLVERTSGAEPAPSIDA